jgi:peptidoglycan/xylan/chitin deacetylase (PgdA/CDA1 family)
LWEPTGEAAERLIPALMNRGFQLVTVSELFYYSGVTLEPGVMYRSGFENNN